MQKKYLLCLMTLLCICLTSCPKDDDNNDNNTTTPTPIEKQLNVTIVLDLSDRLIANDLPSHTDRDLSIVKELISQFKKKFKNAAKAKGIFRVVVTPVPSSPTIATLLSDLEYDFKNASIQDRKKYYDNMDSAINSSLQEVYEQTITKKNWVGSDIWRFFKDDAEIYLEDDSQYRNIFVILTDGYIYHKNSIYQKNNHYSYLTGKLLTPYRKTNYADIISKNQFGLIAETKFDKNIEVLFLELNPNTKFLVDFDIMNIVLTNWCKDMDIEKVLCYKTSPDLNKTKKAIQNFLK